MFLQAWRRLSALMRHQNVSAALHEINRRRAELQQLSAKELFALRPDSRVDAFAQAAAASQRLLGLRPHDVQIQGALAMTEDQIVEMQTGEGKTLAAVMAVYEMARRGDPVHVLTANDYLAQRDAEWMGPVYRALGLSVGFVSQTMQPEQRRRAYACDVTYATANEVGFDFLRDQLALTGDDLVLREFGAVLVDEADSILIDEARIPLIVAGGHTETEQLARRMAAIAAGLEHGRHYYVDRYQRNVRLTDPGIARVERESGADNLYAGAGIETLGAIEAALHARVLLRRDIDYLVRNQAIEMVDEFKGRIAENRRWPAGLQTAL